jgi:hypothetical protein
MPHDGPGRPGKETSGAHRWRSRRDFKGWTGKGKEKTDEAVAGKEVMYEFELSG